MAAIPTQGSTFEKIEIYPLGKEDDLDSAMDLRLGVTQFTLEVESRLNYILQLL